MNDTQPGRRPARTSRREAAHHIAPHRRAMRDEAGALAGASAALRAQISQGWIYKSATLPPGGHAAATTHLTQLLADLQHAAITADRAAGATWAQIGAALGQSPDTTRKHYQAAIAQTALPATASGSNWRGSVGALANQSCHCCGCTDEEGCLEGCYWVAPRLCSSCALDLAGELIGQAVADLPGAGQAIETGDPAPPADLSPEDRARWTARWALTVQARLVMFPGVVFHGIPDGPACQVQIELAGGTLLTRLVNPGAGYMHSPDRLSVGGRGASCTAMAHALLTAALGLDATCPACTGTGWTVWDGALGRHQALRPDDAPLNTSACTDCDGFGIGIPPRVYRAFEEHVVATMNPHIDWRLTRRQVLDWLIAESGDEALAALAMRQARHGADPDIDWAASLARYEPDVTGRHAARPGPQPEGHRT